MLSLNVFSLSLFAEHVCVNVWKGREFSRVALDELLTSGPTYTTSFQQEGFSQGLVCAIHKNAYKKA